VNHNGSLDAVGIPYQQKMASMIAQTTCHIWMKRKKPKCVSFQAGKEGHTLNVMNAMCTFSSLARRISSLDVIEKETKKPAKTVNYNCDMCEVKDGYKLS
jgi:hypothetical protein